MALTYLRSAKELIGQQARWLDFIEEFDFELQHRAGAAYGNADALSRKYTADDADKEPCAQCRRRGFYSEEKSEDACQSRGRFMAVYREIDEDYCGGEEAEQVDEEVELGTPQVREAADFDRLNIYRAKFDGLEAVYPFAQRVLPASNASNASKCTTVTALCTRMSLRLYPSIATVNTWPGEGTQGVGGNACAIMTRARKRKQDALQDTVTSGSTTAPQIPDSVSSAAEPSAEGRRQRRRVRQGERIQNTLEP